MRLAVALGLAALALSLTCGLANAAPTTTRPASSGSGLPSAAEGFPWVATGVVALAVGLIGWRLRRSARG